MSQTDQLWTILLIDDDPYLVSAFSRSLRRQPYYILSAYSAEDAMQIVRTHKVDLVVSDLNMPGMSGTQFLAWLEINYPDVVSIVLSGDAGIRVGQREINGRRVFRLLSKPCELADLSDAIREGLEKRSILKTDVC